MFRFIQALACFSSCLILGLQGLAPAQTAVQLSGTVTDPTGKPVAGARLTLGSPGGAPLNALTDAQGRYQIIRPATSLAGPGFGRAGEGFRKAASHPILAGGGLRLDLDGAAGALPVKITLHTLDGRKSEDVLDARLETGSWRINPFRHALPGRFYWLRIQAGEETFTLRAPWLGGPEAALPLLERTSPNGPGTQGASALAKSFQASGAGSVSSGAAGDTLTLVAVGFQREDRGVESLTGTQDFKLKALGYANVPYKSGAALSPYETERCRLDVHIPAAAAGRKLPVVLHLHGGGLHGGEKNEGWFDGDNWFSRKLMEEGLIIFSANYRLGQDPDLAKDPKRIVFPEYLRDAAAAVAWVRRNLESYGGDPKNFFVSGYSAGAWLAAMIAVDTSYYKAVGFNPRELNGYLAFSAQTYTYGQVAYERGISDRGITDGALLSHVRKHDIPMALFVGGNEGQRISDMQTWLKQMQDAGSTRMTLSIQAGRDHKQLVTTMGNATDDTRTKVMAFIKQYSVAQ